MSELTPPEAFAPAIDHFTSSARAALDARLALLSPALDADELEIAHGVGGDALRFNAWLKLSRVLLLELHAAKRAGELTAEDDGARFRQFIEQTLRPEFGAHLDRRYPPLRSRLQRALDQQGDAIATLLERFVEDRPALERLLGQPAGRLLALSLGQGDLHAGGQTVARLSLQGGNLMYKPRSLRIDAVLDAFLAAVLGAGTQRIHVPAVIDRSDDHGEYGWAAFATHRYCEDDAEFQTFYTGLGHWLAVLRLIGGTDIHLENLIAVGPIPVVIDAESLFEVAPPPLSSGYGQAFDAAQMLIRNSVLRTGIVPFRTEALGFEGVDMSAAGALPDQQPQVRAPTLVGEGTTQARLAVIDVEVSSAQNHPSPHPNVAQYWDRISDGFLDLTEHLRDMDAQGTLEPMLATFEGCRVRDIRRTTRAYQEIGRMLWHPASLHDEAAAIERARSLFERNAELIPDAPSDPREIMGEIDDLRYGDVPIFTEPLSRRRIDAVLADWRTMRLDLEELTIRSALVATDLNRRIREREEERSGYLYVARHSHANGLEARRRKLAANAVERLLRLAVHGQDGSSTWITPEISRSGWIVQPVHADVYFGLSGATVALAGYLHEVENGRADEVDGTAHTLEGALRVMRAMEAKDQPETVGGFSGYGAQIWSWLSLSDLCRREDMLASAVARAEGLQQHGFDGDDQLDIIDGAAGSIVPLLALAEATGDACWRQLATDAARRLEATAIFDEHGARWLSPATDVPSIGFAHGATGVAWALARLVLSGAGSDADRARWRALSDAAFAFEESFYDEAFGNWIDAREQELAYNFHTWCHGSVGIGLAACDLYARTQSPRHLRTLRRAVTAARDKWGSSHTLCHGDLSLRELFVRAAAVDPEACAVDDNTSTAQIVSSIEEHGGMVGGLTRAAFTPGLMTGLAGAIHGLNRMHPACTLASPLLQEWRQQVA